MNVEDLLCGRNFVVAEKKSRPTGNKVELFQDVVTLGSPIEAAPIQSHGLHSSLILQFLVRLTLLASDQEWCRWGGLAE